MKQLRRYVLGAPLFLPVISVCGAIPGGLWTLVAVAAVLVAASCRLWRVAICCVLCALVAGLHSARQEQLAQEFRELVAPGEVVELQGTVERSLRRGCVLNTGWQGVRVVLRGNTLYTPGDQVQVRAQRQEPLPAGVPGVFHAEAWMKGQGIAASLDLVEGEKISKPFSWRTLQHWGLCIRERLVRRLMPPGTEHEVPRQILCSLVLGDKHSAESETLAAFRDGGCLHAFAVSGLHVGLVSGMLWLLLRLARVRPVVIRPLVLLTTGVYVLVTGCAVPAIRAYVMLAVVLLGYILRLRVSLLNTWSFAALLILLVDYSQLYNAGFLLSFGIYATICMAVRLCMSEKAWFGPDDYIPVSLRTPWEMRWSNTELVLRGTVIVSLSAWLVSVPITICFFHSANSLSFLTNIAVAPMLPVVMFCGLLHLCVVGIPWVSIATGWAAHQSAAILLGVVSWFGELPFAYMPAQAPASVHSLMVQGTGYGGSFSMLGNHGLLIDCGNAATAELKTIPALFHAGYTPAVLLVTSPRVSSGGGAAEVKRMWPEVQVVHAHELPPEGCSFETQAGRFVIFPPPAELPRKHASNHAPLVLWETPVAQVLYVGDAAFSTYVPHMNHLVDVAILGKHPQQPVHGGEVSARRLILLPNHAEADKNTGMPHSIPVSEYENVRLNLSGL